jgi:DNA-binding transcriptional regulator YiaG
MYATNNSSVPSTPLARRRVPSVEVVSATAVMALSCAYYVVGTMGLLTPEAIEKRSATSIMGLSYKHHDRRENLAADVETTIEPTPAEDISRIRSVLKPGVLELANLFGVSRQAVYDWQSGAQPSAQVAQKLAALARAAGVFETSGVSVNVQTLRRRVAGGKTLLEAVMKGDDAVQVAESFVGTLKREAFQQQELSRRLAGRKAPSTDTDDYAVPHLSDLT